MPDIVGALGKVPLFESVSKKDLRALAGAAHEMAYEAGTYLIKKEEMGATFFVVSCSRTGLSGLFSSNTRTWPGQC
jgi:hypothetical protein